MPLDLDPDHVLRSPFAAGAFGAAVALKWVPGTSWVERACNVAAGSATAGFGAPALLDWLHVTSDRTGNALAFAVGLFGLSLAAATMDAIKQLKLAEIISAWLGGPKGGN